MEREGDLVQDNIKMDIDEMEGVRVALDESGAG